MKLRVAISWLLLFSFFVLLTPRDIWHECDHDHAVHTSHEKKIEKDDCFACDYGLGFLDTHPGFSFRPVLQKVTVEINIPASHLSNECFDLFSHRGPPQA